MLAEGLKQATGDGPFTPFNKRLGKPIFRGLPHGSSSGGGSSDGSSSGGDLPDGG